METTSYLRDIEKDGFYERFANANRAAPETWPLVESVYDKALTIRSQSGSADACRIDCAGEEGGNVRAFDIASTPVWGFAIEDLTIENGYGSWVDGGAIRTGTSTGLQINNVTFLNNHAEDGGALCLGAGTVAVELDECRFIGNSASNTGGAIYQSDGQGEWYVSLFIGNTAGTSGGMVYCEGDAGLDFDDCIVSGSSAGLYGGAIYCADENDLALNRCTFSGNSCSGSSAILIGPDCTLQIDNTLIVNTLSGWALHCATETFWITNTNIYGNPDGDWVGLIADQLGLSCNVSINPQFCSPVPDEHENWALQSDSPCSEAHASCGTQIGAVAVGCGNTPTMTTNWGSLKARFRH